MKYWITILLILISCEVSLAQYEVSVTTIPVWVKVVDETGKPIVSLKEQDFEILEDGQPMASSCFEEINLGQEFEKETDVSVVAEPQRFVIFLDLYNTSAREYSDVKPALQKFLSGLSNRKVEVMLAALMPDRRLGIVSRFTSDLKRISKTLDSAKANSWREAT